MRPYRNGRARGRMYPEQGGFQASVPVLIVPPLCPCLGTPLSSKETPASRDDEGVAEEPQPGRPGWRDVGRHGTLHGFSPDQSGTLVSLSGHLSIGNSPEEGTDCEWVRGTCCPWSCTAALEGGDAGGLGSPQSKGKDTQGKEEQVNYGLNTRLRRIATQAPSAPSQCF